MTDHESCRMLTPAGRRASSATADHRRRGAGRCHRRRPDAARGPGGARAAVAALGGHAGAPTARQGAPRVLPVDGVPDRPHAGQRAGRAGPQGEAAAALAQHAQTLEDVADHEPDAALGNGGLGRLAACFLDSMATLGLPSFGYGIRYEYGMFAQEIAERPPGRAARPLAGRRHALGVSAPRRQLPGALRRPGRAPAAASPALAPRPAEVEAKAYDMVVPGHGTDAVSTLRLWKRRGAGAHRPARLQQRRLRARRRGQERVREHLLGAVPERQHAGRARAAAAPGVLLRQRVDAGHRGPPPARARPRSTNLADKVAIHLNDTHPAIGVAELMRLLVDEHGMRWAEAWALTQQVFSYTNHTLMPEALETWPVALMQHVLPRHLEIIFRINQEFLDDRRGAAPGRLASSCAALSLIDEARRAPRAHGAPVDRRQPQGQRRVGAALRAAGADHLRRLRQPVARALHQHDQRRDAAALAGAGQPGADAADRPAHRQRLAARPGPAATRCSRWPTTPPSATRSWPSSAPTRQRLADHIARALGVQVDPDSLFDVQVKRIHEYKRQLLNVLHVVTRYQRHPGRPAARLGAAHGDLRRQGGVGLPHGQADHPADPRRGPA